MKKQASPQLIAKWQEMADHTLSKCGVEPHCYCTRETRCCDRLYCSIANDYAKSKGIALEPTGHKTLPFMGDKGCVVPPHLRPLCTLHHCSISSLGILRKEPEWNVKYFELREEIDMMEAQESRP